MSQQVKLSDEVVLNARLAGAARQRSIAGQVESWVRLAIKVEAALTGTSVATPDAMQPKTLAESIATVGKPEGRDRLHAYLETLPFPHYQAHPTEKGKLVRTEEDGTRSIGRFVNRKFEADSVMIARKPLKTLAKKSSRKAGAKR